MSRSVCFLLLFVSLPVTVGGDWIVEGSTASTPVVLRDYSSSNFTDAEGTLFGAPPKGGDLQILFNLAQRQRLQKNYQQANRNFALVLERDPPDEMKRTALLELALIAQEEKQFPRAQQVLSQYIKVFPDDPNVPEILLRQGLLYRDMGTPTLALSKFYAVMNSVLALKIGSFQRYQRLVLLAQTEIAETYYLGGRHAEAAEYFSRLLKLQSTDLNKGQIRYKIIRCLSAQNQHADTVAQATNFLKQHPETPEQAEVRFLLASALKHQGQNSAALQEVVGLLKNQHAKASDNPGHWLYWQQRAGNEIANQLYREGDYVNALEIYNHLGALSSSPAWQLPVWYQMGLIYERLHQESKAIETYQRIAGWQKDLGTDASPGLKTVMEMAKWRTDFLQWTLQTQRSIRSSGDAKSLQ